jgi:GTP-binding protein EngB required for normal cell division
MYPMLKTTRVFTRTRATRVPKRHGSVLARLFFSAAAANIFSTTDSPGFGFASSLEFEFGFFGFFGFF